MGLVRGESGASASSTNSCGMGLRRLPVKRGSGGLPRCLDIGVHCIHFAFSVTPRLHGEAFGFVAPNRVTSPRTKPTGAPMDVHLIDGTYELFRYFFAVPSSKDVNGQEVGAVRGVLSSILSMIEGGATHLGVASDHVVESFRNGLY